ncbi:hypothetical protein SB6419_02393 [Klebsiella spallanzanii]|nr:hypothetical protein SB6419_02393 [Klebsiella spallanzanii]
MYGEIPYDIKHDSHLQGLNNETGYFISGGYFYRRRCFSGLVFCRRLCGTGRGIMKKSTIIMLIVAVVVVAGTQFGWW